MKRHTSLLLLSFCCLAAPIACLAQTGWREGPARGLQSERPADRWEECLLSGDGTMGLMVAGNPYHEVLTFNHSELFLPIHEPLIPPAQGNHLQKIREMMLEGRYQDAADYVVEVSHADGFGRKRQSDLFIPAFQLNLSTDSLKVKRYKRQVDFLSGEVTVRWQDRRGTFTRQAFVSRADHVVVIRLTSETGAGIDTDMDLSLVTTHEEKRKVKFCLDDNFNLRDVEKGLNGHGFRLRVGYATPWQGGYKGYEAAIRVVPDGGTATVDGEVLQVRSARSLLIMALVAPSHDLSHSGVADLEATLDALPADYDTLLMRHRPLQADLMGRVSLDLHANTRHAGLSSEQLLALDHADPAVVERLFDAGRYHTLSAIGINPPNLQGIWGATMTPPWAGDYTTNGNLPTAVAHLLQASTPELMLPLFDKLESQMDDYRTNARVLFRCRGIHIPSHICLHGYDTQFDATWPMTFWTAGAAWYAMFYFDYYLHTLDRDFLRQRALPFMEEAAAFYDDFLTLDTDGHWLFNPSYSPENHPGNSKSQACINATMDVMAAKGLYRDLIAAGQVLDLGAAKVAHWQAMLDRMPPYQLNADGELREWMWGDLTDNHRHRHASHLLGLFYQHDPEIMADSALREGCLRVVDRRMDYRQSIPGGGEMAFGITQLAFAASALGDADRAQDLLTYAADHYWNRNLMTTHDTHAIFNADMSGGYPAMVLRMLAYAEPGLIDLLPACPWPEGSIEGMTLRGGVKVERLQWDADGGVRVSLLSPVSQTVRLTVRGQQAGEVALLAGQAWEGTF